MIKSAVPLREESVAMFRSLCAASEGLTQNPLRVWEWLKILKPPLFVGPSNSDRYCVLCLSSAKTG